MASAKDHNFSHNLGGCHSSKSNCKRENSILSLGSNSILSFKPMTDCSLGNSMILSFDQELVKDPNLKREKEIKKLSQGSQGDQERNCFEISRSYEKLAEAVRESQREEELGWFCSDEMIGNDGSTLKRPNSENEGLGSKRHCASNPYKSKATITASKDPQSIAAKNRRERISQRLRVLQDLVPNGTKVDLVTMLEKAINYVKFLQLQVKVLATDEFWPPHGGKAPELGQVKEAIDAILSSHKKGQM